MRRQWKMTAHSLLPFPKCSVSSEWAISFSCGHPHKYFNCVSLFLQCKLEQQACLTGKDLSIMCAGFCPCSTASIADTNTDTKRGKFPLLHHLLSSFCDSHLLVSLSWIKVSKERKLSCTGGHTKHNVSRIGLQFSHRPNQPDAQRLESILTNFRDYCYPNIPHVVKLLFQSCGN